ncbi:3-deoxy-7-phosphoheptulonate synthase AroG [Janthinobacterium sp. B9-8]|uniref:3-deoxy-7-phosphoheptulonate synthase AroG n=1 Tax=Janthinobacterium sp. B9-8 TaxID=1236179 RepID=UPI00061D2AC3|nr:3-deoxy-7-phosphoheptulonate synthase AroG [Janthinobacterium sp. B9-8]AMC36235.1 phospho-2-dehydro-3-deoxyheptonate aldolase [Janthinobacterium sp. B9-8]
MQYQTDDVRIREIKELLPPIAVMEKFPVSEIASVTVFETRQAIQRILQGTDDRLLVVIGPCSIHDTDAAHEYGAKLKVLRELHKNDLEVVMRVYFEKPRTTVGWKGLINDPYLNGSFNINDGLRIARKLLLDLNNDGMPTAGEFLDMITPQYMADLMSWGAIGARTTESQVHRELASGLSCPVGFKNGTDGNLKIALDAIRASSQSHHFLSVTKMGHSAIVATAGNPDCHIILRGGKEPNFDTNHVRAAMTDLSAAGLPQKIMVDFSHANSSKDYRRQVDVSADVCGQLARGNNAVFGVMIESHLVGGRQDHVEGTPLTYGQSITDGCISWDQTETMLIDLAKAVVDRRAIAKVHI